jgi:hypothetical protein
VYGIWARGKAAARAIAPVGFSVYANSQAQGRGARLGDRYLFRFSACPIAPLDFSVFLVRRTSLEILATEPFSLFRLSCGQFKFMTLSAVILVVYGVNSPLLF